MKNQLLTVLKKVLLLFIAITIWTWAQAQSTKKVIPLSPAPASDTTLSYDGTATLSFQIDFPSGVSSLVWSVEGDLVITATGTNSVTVKSASRQFGLGGFLGFGKGRVIATFDDAAIPSACGPQTAHQDVYKVFTPANLDRSNQIVGPICIKPTDTVTYSIESRYLSVNLDQNIGIDQYVWTLPHGLSTSNPSVDGWKLLYFSSDSSSVTFQVGTMVAGDTLIKVDLGKANLSDGLDIKKNIGEAPPAPVFVVGHDPSTIGCLALNTSTLTFIVNTTGVPAGLSYIWDIGGWKTTYESVRGDTLIVEPGNNSQTITLTSTGLGCQDRKDVYQIKRSITIDNQIQVQGGSTCVAENSALQFNVSGVPDGTKLIWTIPIGNSWSIPSGDINASTPTITVGTTSGYVKVSTFDCPDAIDSVLINIEPNKPKFIDSVVCVAHGATTNLNYKINSVAHATGYSWSYPSGWTPVGSTTDTSFTVTPNGTNVGNIIVSAIGAAGCANNSTSLSVNYLAVKPDSIVKPICINSGVADTVNFHILHVSSGQVYDWIVPSTWSIIGSDTDSTSISVRTDGVNGTYYVKANGRTDNCGSTDYDSVQVIVSGLSFTIDQGLAPGSVTFETDPDPVTGMVSYSWIWSGTNSITLEGETYIYVPRGSVGTATVALTDDNGCVTQKSLTYPTPPGGLGRPALQKSSQLDQLANVAQVYPNPASTRLNVVFTTDDSYNVKLVDNNGRQVLTQQFTGKTLQLDVSNLASGTYYLLAQSSTIRGSVAVVISR